jgi:hypothetical protein
MHLTHHRIMLWLTNNPAASTPLRTQNQYSALQTIEAMKLIASPFIELCPHIH